MEGMEIFRCLKVYRIAYGHTFVNKPQGQQDACPICQNVSQPARFRGLRKDEGFLEWIRARLIC